MTLISFILLAQGKDTWTSFWSKDTTLIGFKDKNGIVKIEPKFKGFTSANKFDDIIAVTEEINENWNSYYLTKAGRNVGKDSLHIFDNIADCESEGYIRFHDRKTDKVGMFNRNGDIVIPADYNDLTRVTNGMIIALKGAEKKRSGEHFSWIGGKEILIDTNNKILVDNFKFENTLNFFSLIISSQSADCDYSIFDEGLNPYIYVSDEYKDYFNNCGESKDWLYPIKNIVISYKDKKGLLQNHFEFLRTDNGYKLISISIRKGDLK